MAIVYYHVTYNGADTKTGADWAHAMSVTEFIHHLNNHVAIDEVFYVAASAGNSFTLGEAVAHFADGTAVSPICIIGVKEGTTNEGSSVAYTDWPAVGSADRPSFACAANSVVFGDYYKIYNCMFTGTTNPVVTTGIDCIVYNTKAQNTSGTANQIALTLGSASHIISSELISDAGYGLGVGTYCAALFCYMHDSVRGVTAGHGFRSLFCVYETLTVGASVGAAYANTFLNNTFYHCTTSCISGSTCYGSAFINNIFESDAGHATTDGSIWTTLTNINFHWKNHCGDNITDMYDGVEETVIAHKDNAVTGNPNTGVDPLFDAVPDDLSLASGSPCINAGLSPTLGCP